MLMEVSYLYGVYIDTNASTAQLWIDRDLMVV
ncbi:hypothetical protein [uncultured Gammaproteobacteria bacterium]|nr:hypothetical protein [uncultured Gammaproteobacteria bacterium]CAC9611962.1 hypothetical protein [uncultured Gammaproteobacteria bacterium]